MGMLGHLGMVLAALLLGFAWGVPAVQTVRRLSQMAAGKPMNARRVAASMAVAAAALVIIGAILTRPGRVAAPAVVEYAPLEHRAGLGPRLRRRDPRCQRRCGRAGPADRRAAER